MTDSKKENILTTPASVYTIINLTNDIHVICYEGNKPIHVHQQLWQVVVTCTITTEGVSL